MDNHRVHVHFENIDKMLCFQSIGGDGTRVAGTTEDLSEQDDVLIHKHSSLLELAKMGLCISCLTDRGISLFECSDEVCPNTAVGVISGFGKLSFAVHP